MKKKVGTESDDLLGEYDFSKMSGVRKKYAGRLSGRVLWISLDPDVATVFPTGAAVNRALRSVMKAPKAGKVARPRAKAALRRSAA